MKKLLVIALLTLASIVSPVTVNAAPASIQQEHGWMYAGSYASYAAACRKARYLQQCGYRTCIKYDSDHHCYCVYCCK